MDTIEIRVLLRLHACVTTPSFMVGFNGTVQGYFRSTRGLRQGDPLSPYLFVMAMNCLSILLHQGAAEGSFGYHHHCKDSKLTHLCFADDLLIFCDSSLRSVKNVLQIIQNFTDVSGLVVSISKTSFFSCGIQQPMERDDRGAPLCSSIVGNSYIVKGGGWFGNP